MVKFCSKSLAHLKYIHSAYIYRVCSTEFHDVFSHENEFQQFFLSGIHSYHIRKLARIVVHEIPIKWSKSDYKVIHSMLKKTQEARKMSQSAERILDEITIPFNKTLEGERAYFRGSEYILNDIWD